jgi:hypothetical protein
VLGMLSDEVLVTLSVEVVCFSLPQPAPAAKSVKQIRPTDIILFNPLFIGILLIFLNSLLL